MAVEIVNRISACMCAAVDLDGRLCLAAEAAVICAAVFGDGVKIAVDIEIIFVDRPDRIKCLIVTNLNT